MNEIQQYFSQHIRNLNEFSRHVDDFVKMMKQKGYNGHFLCNTAHPGKLEESFHKHLLHQLQGSSYISRFYLTTYSHWENDERPYVKCGFTVRYNNNNGFNVDKLRMDYANQYGSIRRKDILLETNLNLPDREQVNRMMIGKKKKMRI